MADFSPTNIGLIPLQIQNLSCWLDAADASTITSSGGLISAWKDKSNNACNATQATGGNQPSTGSATINGLNAIGFNGSSSFFSLAKNLNFVDGSLFVVLTQTIAQRGMIMSLGTSNKQIRLESDTRLGVAASNNNWVSGGGLGTINTTMTLGLNTPSIAGFVGDTTLTFYKNNTSETGGVSRVNTTAFNLVNIGSFNGASTWLGANIGEIVFYSRVLTSTEILAINRYLANKWSIAL